MQHYSNPVIATNERIIIRAILGFEEECGLLSLFYHIWARQLMERDHLNILSIPFQQ